jgi:hypothetical protein
VLYGSDINLVVEHLRLYIGPAIVRAYISGRAKSRQGGSASSQGTHAMRETPAWGSARKTVPYRHSVRLQQRAGAAGMQVSRSPPDARGGEGLLLLLLWVTRRARARGARLQPQPFRITARQVGRQMHSPPHQLTQPLHSSTPPASQPDGARHGIVFARMHAASAPFPSSAPAVSCRAGSVPAARTTRARLAAPAPQDPARERAALGDAGARRRRCLRVRGAGGGDGLRPEGRGAGGQGCGGAAGF